jgi:predicted phosphohydrolase
MNVWAISDLHLSFARPDRRERHAARWRDHAAKVEENWRRVVKPPDVILIPGDLSGAGNHRDVQPDLAWLHRLPGTKVIAPGNHDRWWNTLADVRRLLRASIVAVDGGAVTVDGLIACGMTGVPVSTDHATAEDANAIKRQMEALQTALHEATALRGDPAKPLYVLWHFPPFDAHARPGPAIELLERASVTACLYGHLHNEGQWQAAFQGRRGGIRYHCVAADAIGFQPLLVDIL